MIPKPRRFVAQGRIHHLESSETGDSVWCYIRNGKGPDPDKITYRGDVSVAWFSLNQCGYQVTLMGDNGTHITSVQPSLREAIRTLKQGAKRFPLRVDFSTLKPSELNP